MSQPIQPNANTRGAQRLEARQLIGQRANIALQSIDDDLDALSTLTTLTSLRPVVERLLKRQRGVVNAIRYLVEKEENTDG